MCSVIAPFRAGLNESCRPLNRQQTGGYVGSKAVFYGLREPHCGPQPCERLLLVRFWWENAASRRSGNDLTSIVRMAPASSPERSFQWKTECCYSICAQPFWKGQSGHILFDPTPPSSWRFVLWKRSRILSGAELSATICGLGDFLTLLIHLCARPWVWTEPGADGIPVRGWCVVAMQPQGSGRPVFSGNWLL